LTIEEDRSHFGLWALTKATLILGSKVSALSKEQLAIVSNKDLIAINRARPATYLLPAVVLAAVTIAACHRKLTRRHCMALCSVFCVNRAQRMLWASRHGRWQSTAR
jgi:hypothetical protein